MARQIRRFGPYVLILGVLIGLSALLVPAPRDAEATSFVDPWWVNNSSSPECSSCGCGCPRPAEWSPEGVSYRTGELRRNFFLTSTPGVLEDFTVALLWRSEISGFSQAGRSVVPSWVSPST